jgi:hypothetical protein
MGTGAGQVRREVESIAWRMRKHAEIRLADVPDSGEPGPATGSKPFLSPRPTDGCRWFARRQADQWRAPLPDAEELRWRTLSRLHAPRGRRY